MGQRRPNWKEETMEARSCRAGIRPLVGRFGLVLMGALLLPMSPHAAKAAPSEIHIPGDHVFPGSITSTSDGTIYNSSLGDGMIVRGPPAPRRQSPS
jgi:hypothetical protein